MAPKNRAEYRETIAKAFLSVLTEKGLDWKAGWDITNSTQQNAVTGKGYRGVNQFYLGLISLARGYTDPRWATMTQIIDKKGLYHPNEKWHLQAGSKAVFVEYWYPYDRDEKKMMDWKDYRRLSAEEKHSGRYMLRVRYTPVFHASMIDGVSPWAQPARAPQPLSEVVSTLSSSMGVELLYDGGSRAFYRPSEDKIHLPSPASFHDEYEFNATALHELAHATGHESRLNRPLSGGFGTPEYAYEELVAEISSCFMGITLDVQQMPQHLDNHKAYVQGWIEAIEKKPETLMQAIADAQRAARFMDFHAGLISETEYAASLGENFTVSETSLEENRPSPQEDPDAIRSAAESFICSNSYSHEAELACLGD